MRKLNTGFGSPINTARELGDAGLVYGPAHLALLRALKLASDGQNDFIRDDVKRVEAMWEMGDASAQARGFVLALNGGRRVYLQYVRAELEGDVQEDLQILPMAKERYPQLSGGGIIWNDQIGEQLTI
jgi:hypothetical protein